MCVKLKFDLRRTIKREHLQLKLSPALQPSFKDSVGIECQTLFKQETDIPHSNLSVYHPRSFVILLHQAM